MWTYTLKQLKNITTGKMFGDERIEIQHISIDSRKIISSEKTLFIAIEGEHHDGHEFINDMISKGIKNFLVSKSEFSGKSPDINYILVKNTLTAFHQIAEYHRSSYKLPIAAITGSNGKTIVKEWLSQSLSAKYKTTKSPKSYNSQIGVPLSVLLVDSDSEWGIFEAGISLPGEMARLEKIIQPQHGIITNIGQAHQENFSSLEQKVKEKLLLFSNCKKIYYCSDHEIIRKNLQNSEISRNSEIKSWSLKDKNADLFISITKKGTGTDIQAKKGTQIHNFHVSFTDNASLENLLQIINYLIDNQFTEKDITEALENIQPVAMRLELVNGIRNNLLINDTYNSDINSLTIALEYLKQQPYKFSTVILSDIVQSGTPDKILYNQVVTLLKQSGVNRFIGIGEKIARQKIYFKEIESYFFENTLEFLSSGLINSLSESAVLIKGARKYRFEDIVNALATKNHTTLLEINLTNLVSNLNYFRGLTSPSTKIMVMVKALSYGSGSYEIANILQHEKVDYLGVAFTDEGVELRDNGITLPIMVMSPGVEDFKRIIDTDLEPELFSFNSLLKFIEIARSMQISNYPVHIKIDTGMHRLGFMEKDTDELIRILKASNTLKVKWIFSHLAASDDAKHDKFSQEQIQSFRNIYQKISYGLNYNPGRHVLNSAGIERFPEAHFEMVRLGIGLHGISANQQNLMPVSTLKTHITQIKSIPKGDTIGYNRRGKANQDMKIGIIPIGYADGLDRKFGNGAGQVIIQGKEIPFVGDICMDMSMIDLTGINCNEGEEVIVFGNKNPISTLARQIKTIPYEILTNVSSRVKRVYIKD